MTTASHIIDPALQAELRRRFNPDGSSLRRHQLLMLEMLKKIDCICRDNGINYWLSSGTCIGALRHGGFIPWDDDVDIEMFESDFKKLRCLMADSADNGLVWQDALTDSEYVQPFAKIRDTHTQINELEDADVNYKYRGVFIDVFALKPSSSLTLYRFCSKIQNLFFYRVKNISNRTLRRSILAFSHVCITNGLFRLISAIDSIGSRGRFRHLPGTGFYRPRFIDDIKSTRSVSFEDTRLPVPVNAEAYLEKIYGDFRQLPPTDTIVPHVTDIKYFD